MHYVYILYSPNYDKYYVGQTPDLETRLLFHNQLSKTSFTSRYRPWVLKRAIEVADARTAVKMERYIKGRKSRTYLETLIAEDKAVAKLKKRFSSAG